MTENTLRESIDPGTRIGHVHLKVSELERAVAFYRDFLGFAVTTRLGKQAAFLSVGGIITTSASTPGKAPVAASRRVQRPACTTSRSCFLLAQRSHKRLNG